MKKALRIFLPILFVTVIIGSMIWYLFVYDRAFTRDMLLGAARYSEGQGYHSMSTWFYNVAYAQSGNSDEVAIELAQQYKDGGNFTKAEYTLANAIKDGGGIDLYIALCRTYIEQDKLLDAVTMLDNITDPVIKEQLSQLRPAAPTVTPNPGFYNQYISVNLNGSGGTVYASAQGIYPTINQPPYSDPFVLVDGENTIYALTIGENGLVSPLAIYGYTVGGVIQPVQFVDSSIEASIRTILNAKESKQLYSNDLWQIKEYTVPEKVTNCSDLRHMSYVEKLVIANNKVSDFSFLTSMSALSELSITGVNISQENLNMIAAIPTLKKLTLSDCGLSNISFLSKATGLAYLDISNNTVRNIDVLGDLPNLTELNLQHNAVTELSAIEPLSKLTKLDVSYNALTSLASLSKLTSLTWLDAGVNSIADLGQLNNLTALSYVSLPSNQISNVNALASCTAITELDISSNALTDISALSHLVNMTAFNFSYNQVKELPSFPKSSQLVTINGSNNLISKLDKLSGLQNLNAVHMDYNSNISSIKPLVDCPSLVEVNIYATKVKDITPLTNLGVIVNYKPV